MLVLALCLAYLCHVFAFLKVFKNTFLTFFSLLTLLNGVRVACRYLQYAPLSQRDRATLMTLAVTLFALLTVTKLNICITAFYLSFVILFSHEIIIGCADLPDRPIMKLLFVRKLILKRVICFVPVTIKTFFKSPSVRCLKAKFHYAS